MDTELKPVDTLEVMVLVDNYCDELLSDTPMAKRFAAPSPHAVMGEPGLSILLKVTIGNENHTLILDGGISGTCLCHKAAPRLPLEV